MVNLLKVKNQLIILLASERGTIEKLFGCLKQRFLRFHTNQPFALSKSTFKTMMKLIVALDNIINYEENNDPDLLNHFYFKEELTNDDFPVIVFKDWCNEHLKNIY